MIVFAIRSRDTCQKIYSKNAIVIPVHDTKRKHWLLLIVYPKERSIHIFDSLSKPHNTDYAELVDHASLFHSAHFAAIPIVPKKNYNRHLGIDCKEPFMDQKNQTGL